MGFLKGLKDKVTGGGANVTIEYPTQPVKPGSTFHVKVTVQSTGGAVKSKGIFVDLVGYETGSVTGSNRCPKCGEYDSRVSVMVNRKTFENAFPLTGELTIGEGETKIFEGNITIPANAQPSYLGSLEHRWEIRGRVEAFGNDPDSGFKPLVVK